MFIYKIAVLIIVFGFTSVASAECTRINKTELSTVKQIVGNADLVALLTVDKFTLDNSNKPFKGYYNFTVSNELKGDWDSIRKLKIWGGQPYKQLPQYYLDLTQQHNELDLNNISSGLTGFIDIGNTCELYPRFLIGYNYLIVTGVKTTMAFEPINSTSRDKWFNAVYDEILSQHDKRL